MTLEQPIWLLLLLPLGVTLSLWPLPSRWLQAFRAGVGMLIVAALCQPSLRLPDRAGTVVVVADRSDSMPAHGPSAQAEAVNLLVDSMRARDRLAVVAFGETAAVERPPQRGQFGGFAAEVGHDLSNLEAGLETALGLIPADGPGRILILSDGRWTGRDPLALAMRAAERGIGLDYRHLSRPQVNEISIHRFDAPESVAPDQAYCLSAWIESPLEQEVQYQLLRGSTLIAAGSRQLASGLNRLMFRDRADADATLAYQLVVVGAGTDPCPENNQARALVGVRARRALLAVSESGPASGLAGLLIRGGVSVVAQTPNECAWSLEELSRYSAVLLENVLANNLGHPGMETLAAWIEQTGAGLLMTGGRKSYGPGGYFRSPLERILPLSMEMRQEHRKARVAIVVVLDRSGSMAVPAGAGRTKMDLANLGTVQVLDLLMPADEIGVIAVDSSSHLIVGLDTVGRNRAERSRILSIDSRGGGIFIFEALSAAARMILGAQAENKHIILFADAADSEEPGDYLSLLEHCRQANVTVSVVGLGTPTDVDARLLEDIARRGEGNCFFTARPDEIPRLFAQDTFTVLRTSFVEEPTPFRVTAGILPYGGRPDWEPPSLGGYNLCYVRPEAGIGALTTDEYAAPVVAAWQAGSGRVLCFTGEADGKFSGPLAQWDQVGEFYASLGRWVVGAPPDLPGGMLLTRAVREGACRIELHLDPERSWDPFTETPTVHVLEGIAGQPPTRQSLRLEWTSADTLEAVVPIRGRQTVLPTLSIQGIEPVTLTPVCLPYSPEFAPDPTGRGLATLRRLAEVTSGEQRIDLAGIWAALPPRPRRVLLTPWIVVSALILFLLEILERRTALVSRLMPRWSFSLRRKPAPTRDVPQPAQPAAKPMPATATATVVTPEADLPRTPHPPAEPAARARPSAAEDTWSTLRRARQRARARRRPED